MKYLFSIVLIASLISCTSLERFIEFGSDYIELEKPTLKFKSSHKQTKSSHTLLIELPKNLQLPIPEHPDTNFVLQPIDHKLQPGKLGLHLSYNDTISYFNETNYTETITVIQREIPIKIINKN